MTRSHYQRLMVAGVEIYEYEPGFVHAKVYLADDEYAMVGIINLFIALKFFMSSKPKRENLTAAEEKKAKRKTMIALVLGFLIGVECGFVGSAGGALMLMVLTMVMGMDTKLAVGTSSMIMALVDLTGAVSWPWVQRLYDSRYCSDGYVHHRCSLVCRFANKVDEKFLNRTAGIVLILVSVVSWALSS